MPGRVVSVPSGNKTPEPQVKSGQERPVPAARRIARSRQESLTEGISASRLHNGDVGSLAKGFGNSYQPSTFKADANTGAQLRTDNRHGYSSTNFQTSYSGSGLPTRPVSTVRPQSAMAFSSPSSSAPLSSSSFPQRPPSSLGVAWPDTYNNIHSAHFNNNNKSNINNNNNSMLPSHQRSYSHEDGLMFAEGHSATTLYKSDKLEDVYASVTKQQGKSISTNSTSGYGTSRCYNHQPQAQANKSPLLTEHRNGLHENNSRQNLGQDNLAFVQEEQLRIKSETKPRDARSSYDLRSAWQRLYGNTPEPATPNLHPFHDDVTPSRKTPTFDESTRPQNTRQLNNYQSSLRFLQNHIHTQDSSKITNNTDTLTNKPSSPLSIISPEREHTPIKNQSNSDFPYSSSPRQPPHVQHLSVRESPTGQSSSNPDHTSGSNNSSQLSSSSFVNKTLSTFKPQKSIHTNHDPTIGPASKYPESGKITPIQTPHQSSNQNKTGLLAHSKRTGSKQNLSSPDLLSGSTSSRRQRSSSTSEPTEFNIEKQPSHSSLRFSPAFLDSDYSVDDAFNTYPNSDVNDFLIEVSESESTAPHPHSLKVRAKGGSGTATPSNVSSRFSLSSTAQAKTPELLRRSSVAAGVDVRLSSSKTEQGSLRAAAGTRPQSRAGLPVKEGDKPQSMPDDGMDGVVRKHLSYARSRSLDDLRESENDSILSFDIENTMLTVEPSDQSEIGTLRSFKGSNSVKAQLHRLEGMYTQVMRSLEGNGHSSNSRRTRRRWSIGSSDTSSLRQHSHHSRHGRSSAHRLGNKDVRAIGKRFQRLESHVITLARSVAHLSSELRSQNTLSREIENVKREMQELKSQSSAFPQAPGTFVGRNQLLTDFERYQGWVPSLTNPRRVNKLTKFFGQEPPLLEIFLKQLGYEKYLKNFEDEQIGMIELPYMTEDRLQNIGIPMGPRLRILQEARIYFKQGNFDIYFV